MQVWRWPEVKRAVGLSRSTIFRLERSGAFPRRVQLSPGTVGWIREQVEHWLEQKGVPRSGSNAGSSDRSGGRQC